MKKIVCYSLLIFSTAILSSCKCQHKIVVDAGKAPTCTETGLTEGSHCSECNEVITTQEVIPATGHHVVIDASKAPTCTENGLTEGSHCDICGDVIVAQQEVPMLDHNYELQSIYTGHIDGVDKPGLFKCSVCEHEEYLPIDSKLLGLPVLSFTGDYTGISKDKKVKLQVKMEDNGEEIFDCDATLKWQGSSSVGFPKKNYNMTLYKSGTDFDKKNKVKLVEEWGKQSKYTLKANWVDYSQMRNVVSGKLYGQVVKSRNIDDEFNSLVNGGAIDGFPVVLYENGTYQGLYTLNIPKDDWLFDMDGDENDRMALLSTNAWNNTVALREHIPDGIGNGWELEYSSTDETEVGNDWIVTSFNTMMDFINNNNGADFKNGIGTYVNVDRVIDQMLFTSMIKACDNSSKNIIWATYDGVKWQPSMYDMDGVFGLVWDGSFYDTAAWFPYTGNALWEKIWMNYQSDVVDRYFTLRESVMSIENITKEFTSFDNLIPKAVRELENIKWPSVPSISQNNLNQIVTWSTQYLTNFDSLMETYK